MRCSTLPRGPHEPAAHEPQPISVRPASQNDPGGRQPRPHPMNVPLHSMQPLVSTAYIGTCHDLVAPRIFTPVFEPDLARYTSSAMALHTGGPRQENHAARHRRPRVDCHGACFHRGDTRKLTGPFGRKSVDATPSLTPSVASFPPLPLS